MGNYKSAYITKQPNAVDPSDWIAQQEQTNLYYSELKRKREQDEANKKQKQFDGDFDGEWDWSSSGDGTIDNFLSQMGMQAIGHLKESKEQGEKALYTHGANSKEYRDAKQRYDNLMLLPKQLKLATTDIKTLLAERQELTKDGKYFQGPSDIDKLDSFSKQPLKYKFLPNGTALVNSGEITSGIADFGGSFKLGGLYEKIDENAIVQDIATKFKDKIIENRRGYTTTKRTNSWENYTDPTTNKTVGGIKNALTQQYEELVTDQYAKNALANRGVFTWDKMTDEQKEGAKATLINDMVENSRPYIKEAIEEDFDTSARNQDSRIANEKRKENKEEGAGISFVESVQYGNTKEATANIYAFKTPYKPKTTNKNERPKTLHQIRYDEENGNVVIMGKEYVGKNMDQAISNYEKAVDDQNKAYEAWVNEKDQTKANQLYSDYKAKTELTKVAKTKTDVSKNPDDWKDVTISNKAEVTSLLSQPLGVNSYEEIQAKLKRQTEEEETNVNKENAKPVYKGLDDEGNPIFE